MSDADLIRTLTIERDELRERVRQLEEDLRTIHNEICFPQSLRLSRTQERILAHMLERSCATKESLRILLYSHRVDDERVSNVIHVHISHMRPRLKRFAIEIETIRGIGFALSDESKAILRSLLETGNKPAVVVDNHASAALTGVA